MSLNLRIGHAAIYARDKSRLLSFYQEVFNMRLLHEVSHEEVSRLSFNGHNHYQLSVVSHPKEVHMTFYTKTLADLVTFRQRLMSSNIPAGQLLLRDEGVSFQFSDPEGNRIEMAWLCE